MISTAHIIVAQLVLAMVAFHTPSYNIKRWHVFILYQANNIITIIYNFFCLRRAPWTHNIGCELKPIGVPTAYCYRMLTYTSHRFARIGIHHKYCLSSGRTTQAVKPSCMAQQH